VAPKYGLGKGLNALLPVDDDSSVQTSKKPVYAASPLPEGERLVPLEKLRANPLQPRKIFEDEGLRELADSIREHGIIQPIIVDEASGGEYTIVAGERRFRAAVLAGLTEMPVILRTYSDEKRLEVSLIENIQRADLSPIEEALAYKRLMDMTGLSQEEVSVKVGKKRSTVANTLRLLKLPKEMQEHLETGALSPGHARALLSITDSEQQKKLFQRILSSGISVREAEKFAARNAGRNGENLHSSKSTNASTRDPDLAAMEEKLIEILGTKAVIDGDFQKGTLRIEYYSMEDLERLYEIVIGPSGQV
jgi:ParB family chromosome partitioning protein